jgi:hypothetical protein
MQPGHFIVHAPKLCNGGICLGMNYSVLNEVNQNE